MVAVPAELCRRVGVPEGSSVEAVVSALSGLDDVLDGLLISEESRIEAIDFVEMHKSCSVIVVDHDSQLDTRYIEVSIGSAVPVLVGVIGVNPLEQIPTKLELLVFLAVLKGHACCSFGFDGSKPFCRWRSTLKSKIIVAANIALTASSSEVVLIRSLLGVDFNRNHTVSAHSILDLKSSITISKNISDFNVSVLGLIHEAMCTRHPKWRFLSLYRILEYHYIKLIKERLLSDFDNDPGSAIDSARESISKEVAQLLNLTSQLGLETFFERFHDEADALKQSGNQFAHLIFRSSKKNQDTKYTKAQKGVVLFYAVRCSIAHAGTSSVFYERVQDSGFFVSTILPVVEEAVFGALGVSC